VGEASIISALLRFGGTSGQTLAAASMATCSSAGPFAGQQGLQAQRRRPRRVPHAAPRCRTPGQRGEVRVVGQVDFGIALVEEQFLPLPDHAQRLVVEQHDLHRQAL
jgi:hypothetical protein